MFCIAAFIILAITGIFSASHREMTKKAWYCVVRKLTFKPCDINFSEELKGKILGKLIFKRPKLAKFLDKSFDWLAFAFVALTIWSIFATALAGLNLFVYDTCDPISGEACSLSGEACGISKQQLSLFEAIEQNRLGEYITTPFITLGETISRVPDRFKTWNAKDYLTPNSTFYNPENPNLPYALEVIDPSCIFCKQLFENIKQTDFTSRYNLTYIAYPIPDPKSQTGQKFPNSKLITNYLEATKQIPPQSPINQTQPADWQLLELIFTTTEDNLDLQSKFNAFYDNDQAIQKIHQLLTRIGYTESQIQQLQTLANSESTAKSLNLNRQIIEQQIKTIKIPTIIYNSRRHDRLISPEQLSQ